MIKFNNNKKLKIMQITDIQEIPNISEDTLNLLNCALDQEQPDLVILTGDQIKGYGITYKGKGEELYKNVAGTINKIMKPVTSRNIPFAVTFGNHDRQAGLSNEQQFRYIYSKLPNCIQGSNVYNAGTFNIPVYSSDGANVVFNIYLMDSQTDKKSGGYEPLQSEQLEWYRNTRERLKTENGKYIPSILFQHIPLPEYYNLLKKASRFSKGAVRAYRTHKNKFYMLGDNCDKDGIFLEPPSIPDINIGEFDAISEKEDVIAVFVGHDHKNSFVGRYKNITMGFTPSAGFNEYGNGMNRGVRVIELDENNISDFRTKVVTYSDLGFERLKRPVKDFLFRHFPASIDAAKILIRKIMICILTAVFLLCIIFR